MSRKSIRFSDFAILYETYSKEEYDRKNKDLPSLLVEINARNFGGHWNEKLRFIESELNYMKQKEMQATYINTIENIKLLKPIEKTTERSD